MQGPRTDKRGDPRGAALDTQGARLAIPHETARKIDQQGAAPRDRPGRSSDQLTARGPSHVLFGERLCALVLRGLPYGALCPCPSFSIERTALRLIHFARMWALSLETALGSGYACT